MNPDARDEAIACRRGLRAVYVIDAARRAVDAAMYTPRHMSVRIGVSACLLGQRVRYDGGDQRQPWLDEFDAACGGVEWVPVCPEVELGLGVPRETIDVYRVSSEQTPAGLRLIASRSRRDLTDAMTAYAAERIAALMAAPGIDGYVFKARSPSCGVTGTRVLAYAAHARVGAPTGEPAVVGEGRGMFAAALIAAHPDLPVAQETDLAAPAGRAAFWARVRAHRRARRSP
jgi:uncharacterized protein YbbK (DUF523 family)